MSVSFFLARIIIPSSGRARFLFTPYISSSLFAFRVDPTVPRHEGLLSLSAADNELKMLIVVLRALNVNVKCQKNVKCLFIVVMHLATSS